MQAILIYNTNAGNTARHPPEALLEAIGAIGYSPVYRATPEEADLLHALADAPGTVFVAGGDGTLRATALHLIGRGVCLAPLPMGTANNIGRTLGLEGDPLDLIQRYRTARPHPFDVGRLTAPWGVDHFLEACGCGVYADVLAQYRPEEGKSPLRALTALSSTLVGYDPPPVPWWLEEAEQGGACLMLEVMNTRATGPRMNLAPEADPADGLLDVVCVSREGREGLLAYVAALMGGHFTALESVTHARGSRVDLEWHGQPMHVDGEVRPGPDYLPPIGDPPRLTLEVLPGALSVLIPEEGSP